MPSSLLREAAATTAAALTEALTVPPDADPGDDYSPTSPRWRDQSLSKGAAGVALLHGLRAQDGYGGIEARHAWLARATRDDLSAGPGAGLWFGAPALAFAVATAAPSTYPSAGSSLETGVDRLVRARLNAAHKRVDRGLRPSAGEFDLVRGLTGLGAHLLAHHRDGDLLRDVLTYLVRLTEPVPAADLAGLDVPGWWTTDVPHGPLDRRFADGHAGLGMAHGISGPLALLALAARDGVTVPGHHAALTVICRWLDTWKHVGPGGPWWPERITLDDVRAGHSHQDGPARPSWCYGTPGIARAQQLAARVLGDRARQRAAEDALVRCLADRAQLARIVDPALCHGWAGVVATAWHAARDSATPAIGAQLPHLVDSLLAHARNQPPGALPGLIEGAAGVALTLHTVATGMSRGWPTCLLIN